MLKILDDYYLLKEVTKVTNKTTSHYVWKYREKIITVNKLRYIRRECVKKEDRKKLSNLYNHIPVRLFCDHIGLYKNIIEKKIGFMKDHDHKIEIFKYKEIEDYTYIVVDNNLKRCLQKYVPFVIYTNQDYKDIEVRASVPFANYTIGFY